MSTKIPIIVISLGLLLKKYESKKHVNVRFPIGDRYHKLKNWDARLTGFGN